jgi:hypothetical protein
VLVLLYNKAVSIPSNTTMFDFIQLFSTPATCFGLLSGHHQASGYTIQLYIYLLLLLTAIHYHCLYISMVTDTPCCTVVFRLLVSTHMCVLWFLFPAWGCIQLVSPVRCVLIWFGRGSSCPVLLVGPVCVRISGEALSLYVCGLGCGLLLYSRVVTLLVGCPLMRCCQQEYIVI